MLTKMKANESTASTPATPERCGLSHMIEPSVSRSLGIVALALELNESDFVAVLCRRSSGRSNLAEQPDRRTRLSGHCAAHSARVPMTGAVVVQCCAVLAGDGLAVRPHRIDGCAASEPDMRPHHLFLRAPRLRFLQACRCGQCNA